jgi:hypothetical protein
MIRVVLDTSVLVSAVISPAGPNAQVFDLIVAGKIRPHLTDDVLAEYYRVFDYERLQHLDRRRIARLRGLLETVGLGFKSGGRLKICLVGEICGSPIRSNGRRKLASCSPRTRFGIARLQLFLIVASSLSN